jgi:hypothetical protein
MGFVMSAIGTSYTYLTATTANTVRFRGFEDVRVIEARVKFIWQPMAVGSGIRLLVFETEEVIFEATGLSDATPIPSESVITTALQALMDTSEQRQFGFQVKRDAAANPVLYAVWIEAIFEA